MTTEVIFRKFNKRPYETIAIFPQLINPLNGNLTSYMHVGQHGECDRFFREFTRACKDESEYKDLLNELIKIGYDDLKVIQRVNHGRYLKAYKAARMVLA